MITLQSLKLEKMTPSEIGELLITAKKAYYTGGKPIMDDHTYDTLEAILLQKSPYHRLFSKVGHPNFDTGWEKKKHQNPMSSQNKVSTYSDLVHYFELKKIPLDTDFVVEPKCDGISVELIYSNGELVEAITRGDGLIGDVITQNVVKMKNFVPKANKFKGSIRCEIVVTKSDFAKLNQVSNDNYSNARNAASGLSQRLDSQFSHLCSLYAVDILPSDDQLKDEISKIKLLKSLAFTTVDSYLCRNFNEIETIYQQYLSKKRQLYPFDIDGLVVKINNLTLAKKIGSQNNRPKFQVAYKFPAHSHQTRVVDVSWQVGPMGTITPVAKVDPIELSGAIITFASLSNFDLIKEKDLNVGDIVEISRRGDVIPHIEKVVSKVNPGHIKLPSVCPSCHHHLVKEEKFLKCPNTINCLPQILGSLRLFCDTLGILGLSDKTITKLYQANRIRLPGDFFKLTIKDISDLENLGEKSAKNIINQIQSKKSLGLRQIFDSAIIPNFSAKRIDQIISAGYNTPDQILNLNSADVEAIPGFKKTLAQKIITGIKLRHSWVESILSQVSIIKPDTVKPKLLSGLNFTITGNLSRPRQEIVTLIETNGGRVQSAVSSKTSYLISNSANSSSSKFKTAKKLGVKIISETEFSKLLD